MSFPKFNGKAFLAPMTGVSDPALRLICKKMGASLVVTEFTNIHSIVVKAKQLQENKKPIQEFLEYSDKERPLSVQLFGSDIVTLEKAAKIVEPFFDVIDYNMGCPAPHITQQMAGGALLQEINLTQKILKTLVSSVKKPVTLKMRAGMNNTSKFLFKDIAKLAEQIGIQMITLHPRTVKQGYSGKADWSLIKELKDTVNIPVVGNGDITTPEEAKQMLDQTGCDYVMIGRGAISNPFIFKQINEYLTTGTYRLCSLQEKIDVFFEYLSVASNYNIKFSNLKSQAIRFTKGLPRATKLRKAITLTKTKQELKNVMHQAYEF